MYYVSLEAHNLGSWFTKQISCLAMASSPEWEEPSVVEERAQWPLNALPIDARHRVKRNRILGESQTVMEDHRQPGRLHALTPTTTTTTTTEEELQFKEICETTQFLPGERNSEQKSKLC